MHNDKHNDKIYTKKNGSNVHFHQQKKETPLHSVKSGEPFSNNSNGQKSNLLSYQSKINYTVLLEV